MAVLNIFINAYKKVLFWVSKVNHNKVDKVDMWDDSLIDDDSSAWEESVYDDDSYLVDQDSSYAWNDTSLIDDDYSE